MEIPAKCPKEINEILEAVFELLRKSYEDKVDVHVALQPTLFGTVNVDIFSENKKAKKSMLCVTFWPSEHEGNAADDQGAHNRRRIYHPGSPVAKAHHHAVDHYHGIDDTGADCTSNYLFLLLFVGSISINILLTGG